MSFIRLKELKKQLSKDMNKKEPQVELLEELELLEKEKVIDTESLDTEVTSESTESIIPPSNNHVCCDKDMPAPSRDTCVCCGKVLEKEEDLNGGYFIVRANTDGEKYDIVFELDSKKAESLVPKAQQDLYVEVEKTSNIIESLNKTDDNIKDKYFKKLLLLAQAGLAGKTSQPLLAMRSLEELKKEMILIEGQRIKNNYMKELGTNALILSIIAIILNYFLKSFYKFDNISIYSWVWVGTMVGTWISFGARKFLIEFEQLSILEEDMMGPRLRLLYVGLSSIVFVLLLNSEIININIGNASTKNLKGNTELQIILGVLCGLVESRIGISIYEKAKKVIKIN